jgi:hypothetical protein
VPCALAPEPALERSGGAQASCPLGLLSEQASDSRRLLGSKTGRALCLLGNEAGGALGELCC